MKFSFRSSILVLTSLCALGRVVSVQTAADSASTLTNSAGTLRFSLQLKGGVPGYTVDYLNGALVTPVIEDLPLGLTRTDSDFTSGITLLAATAPQKVKDDYQLVVGKVKSVHSQAVERTWTLKNAINGSLQERENCPPK